MLRILKDLNGCQTSRENVALLLTVITIERWQQKNTTLISQSLSLTFSEMLSPMTLLSTLMVVTLINYQVEDRLKIRRQIRKGNDWFKYPYLSEPFDAVHPRENLLGRKDDCFIQLSDLLSPNNTIMIEINKVELATNSYLYSDCNERTSA